MQKGACHPVIAFLQRVWFKVGIRAWTMLKYNYKRNRNFISEFSRNSFELRRLVKADRCWQGGKGEKERRWVMGEATCPFGATLGRKVEMLALGSGREKMTPSFEVRFTTLLGVWSLYLLWDDHQNIGIPTSPVFSPPPTSLLRGPHSVGWRKYCSWGIWVEGNWMPGGWSPRCTLYYQCDHKVTSNLLAIMRSLSESELPVCDTDAPGTQQVLSEQHKADYHLVPKA